MSNAEYIAELNLDESKAVEDFMSGVNSILPDQEAKIGPDVAVKFLMARKFDVPRAVTLYFDHAKLLKSFNFVNMDFEDVQEELFAGKFALPGGRHTDNSIIFIFKAKKYDPKTSNRAAVIKSAIYILNRAIESIDTQRCGVTFLYDMSNSSWSNFDMDTSKTVLDMLQDAFPARLRSVYVLNPPFWASASLAVLKRFMKAKLAEKIKPVKDLSDFDMNQIPTEMGGNLGYDHSFWVRAEAKRVAKLDQHVPEPIVTTNEDFSIAGGAAAMSSSTSSSSANATSPTSAAAPNGAPPPVPKRMTLKIVYSDLENQVQTTRENGQMNEEFKSVERAPGAPTFLHSRSKINKEKNRYNDICANDETRVKLGLEEEEEDFSGKDYINANYIDGYFKKGQFIATQGPLEATLGDFWQMIFDNRVYVVVMITNLFDNGRAKCHKYWPDMPAPSHTKSQKGSGDEEEAVEVEEQFDNVSVVPDGQPDAPRENWDHTKDKKIKLDEEPSVLDDPSSSSSTLINADADTNLDFAPVPPRDKKPALSESGRVEQQAQEQPAQHTVMPGVATYGDVTVKILSETRQEFWIHRVLHISHRNSATSWDVHQLQFIAWPDHGVPKRAEEVLALIRTADRLHKEATDKFDQGKTSLPSPVIVHCSAGVGRTGTFIVSQIAMDQLDYTGILDVGAALKRARSQRARLVETFDQFECCHHVVLAHAREKYNASHV